MAKSSEDEQIQTVSRFPTAMSFFVYLTSSLLVAAGPLYLFSSTQGLSIKDNLPVISIVAGLIVAGLVLSYGNVTYTSQIAFYKSLQASQAAVLPSDIASASVHYSLFFNNFIYFLTFAMFTLALPVSSSFPVIIKFAVSALLPLGVTGYLTKPIARY